MKECFEVLCGIFACFVLGAWLVIACSEPVEGDRSILRTEQQVIDRYKELVCIEGYMYVSIRTYQIGQLAPIFDEVGNVRRCTE